jgi:DNA-binding MarR family transcriptional regulator
MLAGVTSQHEAVCTPEGASTATPTPEELANGWVWGDEGTAPPADAPLFALFAVAMRSMGRFWAQAAEGTGLSPAGLGILRVLVARNGLKSSEVAARGWSTPATVTSVVDTLVRDGYVERRRDAEDRRVVRLFVTEAGRAKCEDAVGVVAPRLHSCVSFVESQDEPVVRKFLTDVIMRFGELMREERK